MGHVSGVARSRCQAWMRLPSASVLSGLLLAGSCELSAGQSCPENQIVLDTGCPPEQFSSFAAQWENASCCPAYECDRNAGAAYDLPRGGVVAFASGNAGAILTVHDIYRISGPGLSGPVPILAHFRVQGFMQGGKETYERTEAWMRSGSLSTAGFTIYRDEHTTIVDSTLTVTITAHAETPFTLSLYLRAAAGNGVIQLEGDLAFSELPPGTTLTSCQGYQLESPIAVERRTWSAIKSRIANGTEAGPSPRRVESPTP
jgi:hypothetical protein